MLSRFTKRHVNDEGRRMSKSELVKYNQEKDSQRAKVREEEKAIMERKRVEEKIWEEEKARKREEKIAEEMNVEQYEKYKADALKRVEISNEKFEISENSMSMLDRIDAHQKGRLFKNAIISNEPPSDRDLHMSRLRTFKEMNDFRSIHLDKIKPIHLNGRFTHLDLVDAIGEDKMSHSKEFCLVSDVFIHYIPLDTFYGVHYPVEVNLNDHRKIRSSTVRWFKMSHSIGYNILFTMDYCMATKDLNKLALDFSTALDVFKEGTTWGVAKIIVSLTFMDFPVKLNFQEVMAVMHLSDSDLRDFISDPQGLDAVMSSETLKRMKQLHKQGEIENVNEPRDDRIQLNTAKTGVGSDDIDSNEQDYTARDILVDIRNKQAEKKKSTSTSGTWVPIQKKENKVILLLSLDTVHGLLM
jgi:hypothetical protein